MNRQGNSSKIKAIISAKRENGIRMSTQVLPSGAVTTITRVDNSRGIKNLKIKGILTNKDPENPVNILKITAHLEAIRTVSTSRVVRKIM
tara:strand:- start:261 stop:530 length:270 start_codon:yes stop_codon:yes gene_type:complete